MAQHEDERTEVSKEGSDVDDGAVARGVGAGDVGTDSTSTRRVSTVVRVAAAVVAGVAMTLIVAGDGSPGWQLVRALVVAGATGLVIVVVTRLPARPAGAVEFGVGLVVFAVGVGIGVPHVSKTGFDLLGSAGAACLLVGVVLLVAGGTDLLRSARVWQRVLAVPALLILVALSAWTLGQAVAATNVPATRLGGERPADRGMAAESVEFTTSDDVTLSGWYVPSSSGAAVVLLHGAGSTRSSVLDQAEVLSRHGYGVLLFDARGHGRSGGRAMDFGWYGDQDVAAAVSNLADRPDVDAGRIGAVGMSMGGEEAIGALGADDRIRAVVAEGATNRVTGDKAWLAEEHGWRGRIQMGIESLTFGFVDGLTEADPPGTLHDALAGAAPRPVLLIAGGAVPDEVASNRWLREHSPESVDLWVAPSSGHTDALEDHPRDWERRVTGFLDSALAPAT